MPGSHCVPPTLREYGRNKTDEGKRAFGNILNEMNYNHTNQNDDESSDQCDEDGGMSLQSKNHKITIEKCNVFEYGSCYVCNNELTTGVTIRVDDSQHREMEYAPECPAWHCLGCWEPTSPVITKLFQHTTEYHLFLCRLAISIHTTISGWLLLECRDRLHVISHIFEQNLSTATVTMNDISRFFSCGFSCGSANCHDSRTPGLVRRHHSDDDFDEAGEIPMQIDYDLESHINSWVEDDDMHDNDQSSVHSSINHGEDQSSVQASNQTSTQHHTLAHANSGSMRHSTSTTGRTTTERLSLPPQNSGQHTRSQARGQYCQTASNRQPGITPNLYDLASHSVTFCETKCSNCKRFQFDDSHNSLYRMDFHVVSSKDISQFGHPYQTIKQRKADKNVCDYNLCDECYHFLVKKERDDFEHMWPAFFWHLLSNSYSPTFGPSQ